MDEDCRIVELCRKLMKKTGKILQERNVDCRNSLLEKI